MPKICYVPKNFKDGTRHIINCANDILDGYEAQGLDLTLRQLYYQFIARDLFPESWMDERLKTKNTQKNYHRLGSIINNGRLAGHIDWDRLEDRTREVKSLSHWDSPEEIIDVISRQYRRSMWEDQDYHVEVWIEKEALSGVIEGVCQKWDVPYFACKGYTSQSEMWRASQRLIYKTREGKTPYIIHMSDHDPSGIDMANDIENRMSIFTADIDFKRIALTIDQVHEFNPPPNWAKITDSRAKAYIAEYGEESWELDALEPAVMSQYIEDHIKQVVDEGEWEATKERQKDEKRLLGEVSRNWDEVVSFVDTL